MQSFKDALGPAIQAIGVIGANVVIQNNPFRMVLLKVPGEVSHEGTLALARLTGKKNRPKVWSVEPLLDGNDELPAYVVARQEVLKPLVTEG